MKKNIIFSLMVLFTMGIESCSSSNDDNGVSENSDIMVISETEVSTDVSEFFGTELPKYSGTPSTGFFVGTHENLCYVINSIEELKSLYKGEKELPKIDFSSKTLIIGQQYMEKSPYYAKRVDVSRKSGTIIIEVHVQEPDYYYNAFANMYFWCLCSKFYGNNVKVNVIREN